MNKRFLNEITCGDSEQLIQELDDNSIDLVVTSPPYNVDLGQKEYKGVGQTRLPYNLYNDNKEHQEYIDWLQSIFGMIKNKLVSGGRIAINIADTKNGAIPTHSDVIQFMVKELDYLLMSTIVWNKNQTGNRAAWGSYMSPSSPSFPCPYEYIIIFAKDSKKKIGDKDKITISKENFIKNAWGVWAFAPEIKQKKYGLSAMFPKELPKRCIEMLSYKDDVVFDPFSGMGTTCLVAKSLERNYIGFELSVDYCKKSRERIAND